MSSPSLTHYNIDVDSDWDTTPEGQSLLCSTYDLDQSGLRHYIFFVPPPSLNFGKVHVSVWPTYNKDTKTLGISLAPIFPLVPGKPDYHGWKTLENRQSAFDAGESALSDLHKNGKLKTRLAHATAVHLSKGRTDTLIQALNYITESENTQTLEIGDKSYRLQFCGGKESPGQWEADVQSDYKSLVEIPPRGRWTRGDPASERLVEAGWQAPNTVTLPTEIEHCFVGSVAIW